MRPSALAIASIAKQILASSGYLSRIRLVSVTKLIPIIWLAFIRSPVEKLASIGKVISAPKSKATDIIGRLTKP
jgi:hypothetical protein